MHISTYTKETLRSEDRTVKSVTHIRSMARFVWFLVKSKQIVVKKKKKLFMLETRGQFKAKGDHNNSF